MTDLLKFSSDKPFTSSKKKPQNSSYSAEDIEVLEGLDPVRKRPGMYIGGTDEMAMHHLVWEIFDNAMDEAVAGFAKKITMILSQDGSITIADDGRGIPVDPHPKFPEKSALEVILTTLHSGGKFSNKAYQTAGGLHGVGLSVVNALAEFLTVEVYRDGNCYRQEYARGRPQIDLTTQKAPKRQTGTSITFRPDSEIFGSNMRFKPEKIFEQAKAKAYLYRGVSIDWQCEEELIKDTSLPKEATIHFPGGIAEYIASQVDGDEMIGGQIFAGLKESSDSDKIEWAICWQQKSGLAKSYCNTIPTPLGGTHEQGFRGGLTKAVKNYCAMAKVKRAEILTTDDIMEGTTFVFSAFISEPVFQGQTKDKLVSKGISKPIESTIKDHFEHWLSNNKQAAQQLIESFINAAEYRLSRKTEKQVSRKTATQKLRLPGKLADCTSKSNSETELFLVEGDSAGGSAKQARDRNFQAILPLRGKILNVASSPEAKIKQNQEIQDLEIALGISAGKGDDLNNLRYGKVIIMTDADVDGAHIASLLMTFFYIKMPALIEAGHLYLARPPLYRLTQNNQTYYASTDQHKAKLTADLAAKSKAKIEVGRFKGLGEMTPKQLKETTMLPKSRQLFKVSMQDVAKNATIVDELMGKNPEKRFAFIKKEALENEDLMNKLFL